tara:strand:+ start:94 stop:1038 length:945 start_codon:yes stop_codon:yes gene_type:complete
MNKTNVIIFGHGNLAIELIKYIKKYKTKFNLYCVVLSSNSSMFENSLEHYCVANKILFLNKLNIKNLKKVNKPLIGFSCLYDKILKFNEIKFFDLIINTHLSYLPSFRGLNPVNWAMKEKKQLGFTLHTIKDHNIDLGNIIIRKKVNKISNNIFENTIHLEKKILTYLKLILQKYPSINFIKFRKSKIFSKKKYYNKKDYINLGSFKKKFFSKQKFFLKKKINNMSYIIINDKIDLKKTDKKNYYLFFYKNKSQIIFRENIRFYRYKSLKYLNECIKNLINNNIIFNHLLIFNNVKIKSQIKQKIIFRNYNKTN